MVERELPFSMNAAQRYMAIASAEHLQKLNTVQFLPSSWGTLYVLQRLDEPTFNVAVAAGKVHPEMTREEAEALLPDGMIGCPPHHPAALTHYNITCPF